MNDHLSLPLLSERGAREHIPREEGNRLVALATLIRQDVGNLSHRRAGAQPEIVLCIRFVKKAPSASIDDRPSARMPS